MGVLLLLGILDKLTEAAKDYLLREGTDMRSVFISRRHLRWVDALLAL